MEYLCNMSGGMRHAIAKDTSRYAIRGVEVRPARFDGNGKQDPDGVYLTATDGHVLAVKFADGETAEPIIVPGDLLPSRKAGDKIMRDNGRLLSQYAGKYGEPVDGAFPPCADIFPVVNVNEKGREGHRAIGLNARLLWNLARAICDDGEESITLLIPPTPTKPIPVLAADPGHGFGVIMPVRVDGAPEIDWEKHRADYTAALNGKASPSAAAPNGKATPAAAG